MATVGLKRGNDTNFDGTLVAVKRNKYELDISGKNQQLITSGPPRTSSLLAPIMLLTGHEGEIYTAKFHPDGEVLASGSFERKIFLWNIYGECENYAVLEGHKGAVLDLHFSTDGSQLFSASTDKTAAMWDFESGQRIKKFKSHTGIVNSCHPSRRGTQMLVTGSDDCTSKLWDVRRREPIQSFQSNYQVTAVTFNDTGDQIITGGLDNVIRVWDLRKNDIMYAMPGHRDTITSLSVSPDGCYVMSNAMDNSVRIWDIRPYVPGDRCLKLFTGAQHNFEKNLLKCSWSPDSKKIAAGSADRFVYVWDTATRRILYKLPGHDGSVNDVQFHPIEPIVMSCGSDKKIYLGELEL